MYMTFDELRSIKHQLPTGSVAKIAQELNVQEQTVRNYFGANKYEEGRATGNHLQPGPQGGIVSIENDTILKAALRILNSQTTA